MKQYLIRLIIDEFEYRIRHFYREYYSVHLIIFTLKDKLATKSYF